MQDGRRQGDRGHKVARGANRDVEQLVDGCLGEYANKSLANWGIESDIIACCEQKGADGVDGRVAVVDYGGRLLAAICVRIMQITLRERFGPRRCTLTSRK